MNRRGFLGFLGVGAVAGPKAAKNALDGIAPVSGGFVSRELPSLYPAMQETSGGGIFKNLSRISKLQKLISGEESEEEDPWATTEFQSIMAEHQIKALGSVAPVHKARMLTRERRKLMQEQKRKYWIKELFGLENGTDD